jgi:outer membrane biosynthesis protein TonB
MYDSETGTGTPDTPLPYWDSETGQGTPTIPNYYFDSETGISWSRGGGGGFYWDGLNEPQFSFTPEQQQQLDSFVANPTLSGLETNPLGYGGPLFRFTEPQSAPVQAPPPPPPEPVYQAPVTPQPAPIPPPAPTVTTPTPTASPTMATSTTSNIDPTIQPYLSYGLSEAQKQYQAGGPQYYGGQTYVSPSQTTQTGLQALEARASQGSPLTGAAQGQLQNTIQGGYLQGNPFFQGAFKPAAQAAESQFLTSLGNIGSAASKAGRYGSGAMNTMQQGASGQFAKTLADTAGTLAYQNYDAERSRQQAATMAAPQMAQADYGDIQNMLKAGQLREGYTGAQQQADINRFNFQQNQPQVNLTNYLSGVYGNPMGRQQLSAGGGQAGPSGFQNLLGTAATLGGLYKNVGGVQGLSNIGNWLSGGNSVSNLNPYSGEYMGSLEF